MGVDFGTLSGLALVVCVADGAELASAVRPYARAVLEQGLPRTGAPLPPDWALQVPADWVEVLRTAVPQTLAASRVNPAQVVGIGTGLTACTVLPAIGDGTKCGCRRKPSLLPCAIASSSMPRLGMAKIRRRVAVRGCRSAIPPAHRPGMSRADERPTRQSLVLFPGGHP